MTEQDKIQALADLVLEQTRARLRAEYSGSQADAENVQVKAGKKYTKIDRGAGTYFSGYLMVEHETGVIYGIKGYGVPHKQHRYGTLDTISEWYWGAYGPQRVPADMAALTERERDQWMRLQGYRMADGGYRPAAEVNLALDRARFLK